MTEENNLELDRFEAELLSLFEKKKFILTRYTAEGFGIQGEGVDEIKVNMQEVSQLHKEGMTTDKIMEIVLKNQKKLPQKPDIEKIYPLIKDKYFAVAYQNALKQVAEKAGIVWDPALLPLVFRTWQDRDIYTFFGIPTERGYRYLNSKDFERIAMEDKAFLGVILDNLNRKIDGFLRDGKIRITKQSDGNFTIHVEEDLAVSFLLIAHKYFEFLQTKLDNKEAEFFYAIAIATEEVVFCDPKTPPEKLKEIISKCSEKQKEFTTSLHHQVSIEPMVITKNGISFLPKG